MDDLVSLCRMKEPHVSVQETEKYLVQYHSLLEHITSFYDAFFSEVDSYCQKTAEDFSSWDGFMNYREEFGMHSFSLLFSLAFQFLLFTTLMVHWESNSMNEVYNRRGISERGKKNDGYRDGFDGFSVFELTVKMTFFAFQPSVSLPSFCCNVEQLFGNLCFHSLFELPVLIPFFSL